MIMMEPKKMVGNRATNLSRTPRIDPIRAPLIAVNITLRTTL
jgi:hypothetical protein